MSGSLNQNADAVTYIPYTHTFYVGSVGEGKYDDFSGRKAAAFEPIAILHPEKLAWHFQGGVKTRNLQAARSEAIEYVNTEMLRQAERHLQGKSNNLQAATDSTSLKNITRVELMTEIINRQYKDVYLINGVTQRAVPKLKLDFDLQIHVKTRGSGALVKKRQKSMVEAPEFVQVSFDMVKYGKLQRVIDTTDEDELSALISPMSTALDDIAQVISQDENLLIKDALASLVDKSKGSWSAMNTDGNFSARNPLADLTTEIERIVASPNHGRPKIFASNLSVLGTYLSNTFLRGYTQALDRDNDSGVGALPGFPGLTRITDVDLPANKAYIYDPRAIQYGLGPMISESFRDPQTGVSGNVVRKWVQPVVPTTLATAFGAELTSL